MVPSRAISQILVRTKDSECHLQMTSRESRQMNMVESKHTWTCLWPSLEDRDYYLSVVSVLQDSAIWQ